MGSVTRSIKRLFASQDSVAARLRRVFTPCLSGAGTKDINIRIFDPHQLVQEMATSQEVVTELENFLRSLATQTGLEASVAAQLSPLAFHVTYATKTPNQAEIDHFGVNDFPIYFLTASGSFVSSSDDIVSLLVSYRIPERTFVGKRRAGSNEPLLDHIDSYKNIEDDWAREPKVLGFGFPGTYLLPRSQSMCRKLGIIKMQGFMTENLPFSGRKKKIVSVLKHEIGHMFGLVHEPGTLMDGDYDVNSAFPSYSNDQLWLVGRALTLLLQVQSASP